MANGRVTAADALLLRRSPRWVVDDARRSQQLANGDALAQALRDGTVRLKLAERPRWWRFARRPRGYAGLGSVFWLMTALALVFYI